ncbi:sur7 protein, partial [Colletotrichum incanum]
LARDKLLDFKLLANRPGPNTTASRPFLGVSLFLLSDPWRRKRESSVYRVISFLTHTPVVDIWGENHSRYSVLSIFPPDPDLVPRPTASHDDLTSQASHRLSPTMAKVRRNSAIAAAVCYFIAIIFLILVIIGNTSIKPVLTDIYFFKLDVSDIIPLSSANAVLLNSVARSLGLHDFYQVGLWNFCEGYNDEGVTYCSTPQRMWWFNPIEILTNELLAGATIALPSQVTTILNILRIGQQVMFGLFISGISLAAALLIATPLVMRTRWWSLPIAIFAAITGLLVTVASIIGTVMSVGARIALTQQQELNINAILGVRMFVFMWLASALVDVAAILHMAMGCCCSPRKEREAAAAAAANNGTSEKTTNTTESGEKSSRLPAFMRKRSPRSSTS